MQHAVRVRRTFEAGDRAQVLVDGLHLTVGQSDKFKNPLAGKRALFVGILKLGLVHLQAFALLLPIRFNQLLIGRERLLRFLRASGAPVSLA